MTKSAVVPEDVVTVEELRQRAEAIRSRAVEEARETVDTVLSVKARRALAVVGGIVVFAAVAAYFLGTQRGREIAAEEILGG